jgi:glycosyltransferase involved in cell wall biosynthesis
MRSTGEGSVRVSGIVHTRNSADTLERALSTLRWVDELLVVDMASDDGTVAIAERLADRVLRAPIVARVDDVRNEFLARAAHEWIFVLDSDEYLASDAANQVAALVRAHGGDVDAFGIPRFNFLAGQIMRGSGWYPDHQVRLFRRGTVRWPRAHHRAPDVLTGAHRLLRLSPPECLHIHHLGYRDLRHFIRTQVDCALDGRYDADPGRFDFADYVAAAHDHLALRRDVECDGDLSHALALLMAWDAIVRGLVHWDSLDPRPDLGLLVALPAAAARGVALRAPARDRLAPVRPAARLVRRLLRRARHALDERVGRRRT